MTQPRYMTPPAGVTVYENPIAFVAENPDREARHGIGDDNLAGWDVADGFRLTETQIPGAPESEWRISIVAGEIYAVLRRLPLAREYTFDGPVWLLGRIPDDLNNRPAWDLTPHDRLIPLLSDLEDLRHEPDSLLTAVNVIRERLPQLTT